MEASVFRGSYQRINYVMERGWPAETAGKQYLREILPVRAGNFSHGSIYLPLLLGILHQNRTLKKRVRSLDVGVFEYSKINRLSVRCAEMTKRWNSLLHFASELSEPGLKIAKTRLWKIESHFRALLFPARTLLPSKISRFKNVAQSELWLLLNLISGVGSRIVSLRFSSIDGNYQFDLLLDYVLGEYGCRSTSAKPAGRRSPQQRTSQVRQAETRTVPILNSLLKLWNWWLYLINHVF